MSQCGWATWHLGARKYLKHRILAVLPDAVLRHFYINHYNTFYKGTRFVWVPALEENQHENTIQNTITSATHLRRRRTSSALRRIRLQAIDSDDHGLRWDALPCEAAVERARDVCTREPIE